MNKLTEEEKREIAKQKQREYYQKNREKRKAEALVYYHKNKAVIKPYMKQYQATVTRQHLINQREGLEPDVDYTRRLTYFKEYYRTVTKPKLEAAKIAKGEANG